MYKRKMAQHRAHRNDEFVALGNEFQNLSQVDDDFVKSKPKKKQRFVKLLVGVLVLVACATAVLIHHRNQSALAEEEQFLAAERNEFLRRTMPPSETMRDEATDPSDINAPFRQEMENIQSISDGPATKFHRVPEMPSNDAVEPASDSPVKNLVETMDMEAHSAAEEGENVYTPIHTVRIPKLRTASLDHMKQGLNMKTTPHLIEDQLSLKTNILPVEKQEFQEKEDADIYSRPRPPYREEPRVDEDPADDGQYDDNAAEVADGEQFDAEAADANAVDTENIVVDANDYIMEVGQVKNDDGDADVPVEDEDADDVLVDKDLAADTQGGTIDADDNALIDDTGDENLEAAVDVDEGELGNDGVDPGNEELDDGEVAVVDEGDRVVNGDEGLDVGTSNEVEGFDNGDIGLKGDVEEGDDTDADDDKTLEMDEFNVDAEGEDERGVESDVGVDSDPIVDRGEEQENGNLFRNQDDKGSYPDLAGVKVETLEDENNSGVWQGGDPAAWYNQQEPNAADAVEKVEAGDASSETVANVEAGQQQQYDQYAQQPQYSAQEPQRQVFVYTDPNTGEQRYIVY